MKKLSNLWRLVYYNKGNYLIPLIFVMSNFFKKKYLNTTFYMLQPYISIFKKI